MAARIVYQVHDSPGRLRLRLSWLREHRDEGDPLARALADVEGVTEVQVRPFTGSVLLLYDRARTDGEAVTRAVLAASGVAHVTRPGHETPEQMRELLGESLKRGSEMSRAAALFFEGINVDFLRATGGHMSLGSFATFSLWAAAATKIVSDGRLEMPAWHQLLWWGFRSFGAMEHEELKAMHDARLSVLQSK